MRPAIANLRASPTPKNRSLMDKFGRAEQFGAVGAAVKAPLHNAPQIGVRGHRSIPGHELISVAGSQAGHVVGGCSVRQALQTGRAS